ncbi:hypothetical protein [Marinobacter sp. C2H3]|uniref:hypothetical protein n=1 Tax=Marinobacter sp. C2H3 TaxID=3119003 RepID=UPI00300F74DF
MKRPTSITVIAWFLLISSGLSLVAVPYYMSNSELLDALKQTTSLPPMTLMIITLINAAATFAAGIGMLKGKGWSRALYVAVTVIGLVITGVTTQAPTSLLPGVIISLIIIVLVFRPKASAFFRGGSDEVHA